MDSMVTRESGGFYKSLVLPFLQTLRGGGSDEIRIHEEVRGFVSREPKGHFDRGGSGSLI
jgi:hypothetical protein